MSGFVNFLISCLIIVMACLLWNTGISWHILFAPVLAFIQGILILGIGLLLGACAAYVQDLEYIVNFLLTLAFYGSPIVYKLSMFGNTSLLAMAIRLNPFTSLVNAYRDIFLYHQIPAISGIAYVTAVSLVILLIGYRVFKKLEKGFAEQF